MTKQPPRLELTFKYSKQQVAHCEYTGSYLLQDEYIQAKRELKEALNCAELKKVMSPTIHFSFQSLIINLLSVLL